jgi:periplasmic mercuric ion binding protein
MKRFAVFLVALPFALAIAAPAMAAVQTVRFSVSGWTCGSCAAASRIALEKLDGVQAVTTDFDKREAVIRYDDTKVDPEKMAVALRRLGYAAVRKDASGPPASVADRPGPTGPPAAVSGSVSFFQVPLGCPAIENLGCGSLAMPILADLERSPRIGEAWIEHEGIVLAVVWKGEQASGAGAREVESAFRKNGLETALLTGKEEEEARKSFSTRSRWYRGEDVAKLSKEEARVLAARLVEPVEKELGAERAASLRTEFTAAFESCFIGNKPLVREDFEKIARKYVGQKGLEKMEAALEYCSPEEK